MLVVSSRVAASRLPGSFACSLGSAPGYADESGAEQPLVIGIAGLYYLRHAAGRSITGIDLEHGLMQVGIERFSTRRIDPPDVILLEPIEQRPLAGGNADQQISQRFILCCLLVGDALDRTAKIIDAWE
jgi:hypothetical protein